MKIFSLKIIVLHFVILILILSCNQENSGKKEFKSKIDNTKNDKNISIIIQPFEGLSKSNADFVAKQLKGLYSGVVVVRRAIPLPKNSLNINKTRYRADSLIRYLGAMVNENQLIIGLTVNDISISKGEVQDWGVFGYGYYPGKSCIASLYRLKGNNRVEKLFKVAIHELGHTQGLARTKTMHCPEFNCLMRDAEGKDHLDELIGFCSKCKPVLINAGWALK